MKRIGIFGGTFNPPHLGHIQVARQALTALNLQKVLLIPNYIAPHKPMDPLTPPPEDRLQMLRLAAAEEPGLEVCDLELRRKGISYTCDTVRALKAICPEAELVLLLGADMLLSFPDWKDGDYLRNNVSLGVFYRGKKGEQERVQAQAETLRSQGLQVYLAENDALPISSTQLKRLLAFQCADEFLPAGVGEYIRIHGLYDSTADWKNLPMDRLESVVVRLLKPSRVNHVLGCRDTAVELARRWGANEEDAARAGILHDITKALDGPLQLTLCGAYGKMLNEFSRKYPKTLHALTGSLVAERIFGENQAVVDAIRFHTTGKAGMNLLEKIIYVADYMEPNRDFPGVEKLRALAFTDITGALKLGLDMTMEHLKNQGSEVSPESREALAYLKDYVPAK